MNASQRALAWLAATVGVLALFVWLTRPMPPDHPRVTPLDGRQVRHILLTRGETPVVELQRGDAGWRLVSPRREIADDKVVTELLGLLSARSFRQLPATHDAARYGLRPPAAIVRFDDTELAFGAVEPVNHKRYVLGGGRIHLIHDRYARLVLASRATDFIATGKN